jgi:hypothetical protein
MADAFSLPPIPLPFPLSSFVLDSIRFEFIGNVRNKGNIMWTLP